MRRLLLTCTYVILAVALGSTCVSSAASAVGRATLRVLRTLAIQSVSDLAFAPAYAGAPATVIAPEEGAGAASFLVQGDANSIYTIRLPESVVLTTGAGNQGETVRISDFTSYPVSSGKIGSDGTQFLFIGATRAALAADQKDGTYSGSFVVEVIY